MCDQPLEVSSTILANQQNDTARKKNCHLPKENKFFRENDEDVFSE